MAWMSSALASDIAAPDAVEAVAVGPSQIRVYWNAVPGATGYAVYRDGRHIGTAEASAIAWTDSSAEPARNHAYAVAAVRASGQGPLSRAYVERTDRPLPPRLECEVLVVGATTAGVAAAVVAARYGLNVVLIEETRRLGGMSVNGLGASDIRRLDHASGFFEEFRTGVARHYGSDNGLRYEPRVAHQVMKEIIWSAPGLNVFRQTRPTGVCTKRGSIEWVSVESLAETPDRDAPRTGRIYPRIVIDATECGDVAAWAGAPYRVGREARSRREPHAGHIYYDRAKDRIMPNSTGKADRRIQAYAYLMTVKDYGKGADRTIEPPAGYNEELYRHAPPWPRSWNATSGKLPNDKYEINQHPYGSDLQGVNYSYPEASYAERRQIEALFRNHALGYLYWIQTGEGYRNIGLSEDDFRADGGWPPLLYIREARRFVADVVMDQTDIMSARELVRPDAIGIADYAMDSHATQPKTDPSTPDMGEGEFYLPQYTPWHQVPFRITIPRRVENLFVVTAVSATHVAYGTYRMEPVRMHFGAATAVAAALCLRHGLKPSQVPANQIQNELLKHEAGTSDRPACDGFGAPGPGPHPALLYMFSDIAPSHSAYRPIQWLGARGFYPCPPPSERTRVSRLAAAPFRPDDPLTADEASRLLSILKERAAASGDAWMVPATPAPADRRLTRGEVAVMLAAAFGWRRSSVRARYADTHGGSAYDDAAEALAERGIDVQVWGVLQSRDANGQPLFERDRIVTRAQFAWWLYLSHRFIGPAFFDHPLDRQPAIPVKLTKGADAAQ